MSRFELIDYDPKLYCNGIKIEQNGVIKWDVAAGLDTLLISFPIGGYKRNNTEILEVVCKKLNNIDGELVIDKTINIGDGYIAMFVSSKYRTINGGVKMFSPGRSYMVLGVTGNGDTYKIVKPKNTDYSVYAESKLRISYRVTKGNIVIDKGSLIRRPDLLDFYRIEVQSEFDGGYENGQAVYRIGNMRIPITKEMMQSGVFFVKKAFGDDSRPIIEGNSAQIEIVYMQGMEGY